MFRGLNSVSIDEKGRITIPTQYRKLIMDDKSLLVITIDTEDRCLLLYPLTQWKIIEGKLEQLPSFHPATRRIQRLLIGHATELELDRQGRILIPPLLREHAGLDRSVMLVGQGKKFELWGEGQWQVHRSAWLAEDLHDTSKLPSELISLSL